MLIFHGLQNIKSHRFQHNNTHLGPQLFSFSPCSEAASLGPFWKARSIGHRLECGWWKTFFSWKNMISFKAQMTWFQKKNTAETQTFSDASHNFLESKEEAIGRSGHLGPERLGKWRAKLVLNYDLLDLPGVLNIVKPWNPAQNHDWII